MWFIETDKATKETDDCESPAMNSVLDDLKVLLVKKKQQYCIMAKTKFYVAH